MVHISTLDINKIGYNTAHEKNTNQLGVKQLSNRQ